MNLIENLGDDIAPHFEALNCKLGNRNKMEAIQLTQPMLVMKKNMKVDKGFFVLKDPILNPGVFDNWVMVYVSNGKRDDELADDFVADLQRASKAFGINVKKPMFMVMKNYNVKDWKKELREDIKDNGDP